MPGERGSCSDLLFITFSAGQKKRALMPAQYKPLNVIGHFKKPTIEPIDRNETTNKIYRVKDWTS